MIMRLAEILAISIVVFFGVVIVTLLAFAIYITLTRLAKLQRRNVDGPQIEGLILKKKSFLLEK